MIQLDFDVFRLILLVMLKVQIERFMDSPESGDWYFQ